VTIFEHRRPVAPTLSSPLLLLLSHATTRHPPLVFFLFHYTHRRWSHGGATVVPEHDPAPQRQLLISFSPISRHELEQANHVCGRLWTAPTCRKLTKCLQTDPFYKLRDQFCLKPHAEGLNFEG